MPVVDSCLTAVKAYWPFSQTDDKDVTSNEKVSKQFPTSSSLCECGISTWPTSQSSPHSTKLYGINHRRRGPTPYSHRITGVLVRNFEMMRHALSKWCVQTLWKTSNEHLWQFLNDAGWTTAAAVEIFPLPLAAFIVLVYECVCILYSTIKEIRPFSIFLLVSFIDLLQS